MKHIPIKVTPSTGTTRDGGFQISVDTSTGPLLTTNMRSADLDTSSYGGAASNNEPTIIYVQAPVPDDVKMLSKALDERDQALQKVRLSVQKIGEAFGLDEYDIQDFPQLIEDLMEENEWQSGEIQRLQALIAELEW